MRNIFILKNNFKFKKYNLNEVDESVFSTEYDDSSWKNVSVPHDWGIEGDFSEDNDATYSMIVQDGMTKPEKQTGRTGGLPIVGEGVYRTWFQIDDVEKAFLEFDGIMRESVIYVNGKKVGGCHFGYLSFEVDITNYVKKGTNLLAIHAIVYPDSSRWYSGGGLYRNVRLITKPSSYIKYNGVWVRQIYVDEKSALFDITIDYEGTTGFTAKITDPNGAVTELSSNDNKASYFIDNPILWDVNKPNLYTAQIAIDSGDSITTRFGVRKTEFTKDGFFLNGRYLKMNGVCLHHDMGSIGAAINRSALLRQLEIMKGMGVNALRTSHNPPATELLDLCDELGILVIDEFFDEWRNKKVENGYSKNFNDHALKDVESIVCRDRNHPSIIMWSIGNEIGEQWQEDGWKVARMLADKTKEIDPTRPITAGLDWYPHCFDNRIAFHVDIVGLNYKPHLYKEVKEKYPNILLYGSETASCISTRGVYKLPAKIDISLSKNDDLTISDYGLCAPPWAYFPERELANQKDNPNVMGEFIWTGFDYLGEPTPYYSEWPSRSSYFGVVDLAGLPKNRYYLYKSAWTDTPTLHIFPHWNWEGMEGQTVPVHIYTNYDKVELFINGVSQGIRTHKIDGNDDISHVERFRLMWNDTKYEPGEICAVAYKNGKEIERKTIYTAGEPYAIELSKYYNEINADGESLNYITAKIVDKNGNLCPNACNRLTFSANGSVEAYATDAGDQRETEAFLRPDKKVLSGMLVCCVRNNGKQGKATVTCSGDGLLSSSVDFECI